MNKVSAVLALVVLCFAAFGCKSIAERFTGSEQLNRTETFWSDVPPMSGFEMSNIDLPWAAKLVMRTSLNNLWRFNKEGEDKTPVQGDWAAFVGRGSPTDVQNFYNKERMASFGKWEAGKETNCFGGKDNGAENGIICVYKKTENNKEILLAIFAGQGDDKQETNVFYLRLEKPVDPSKANSQK